MRMILQKAVKSVAKMVCTIDCTAPAEDKIFDVIAFVCFFKPHHPFVPF